MPMTELQAREALRVAADWLAASDRPGGHAAREGIASVIPLIAMGAVAPHDLDELISLVEDNAFEARRQDVTPEMRSELHQAVMAAFHQMPSTEQDQPLAQRQCVPCRGGVPPLTRDELAPLLAHIDSAWTARNVPDDRRGSVMRLEREYRFANFKEAMAFANAIADVAEEQQHHPDLHVTWGKVAVDIWTHKIGGLTESDVIFAAKCDALYEAATGAKRGLR